MVEGREAETSEALLVLWFQAAISLRDPFGALLRLWITLHSAELLGEFSQSVKALRIYFLVAVCV